VGRSLVDVALSCYPKWWKERYGGEMRAVVDDLKDEGRSERVIAFGLVRDAMRSRFQARGMPRSYGLLANRTNTSVAASTLPWLAVVPFVLYIMGRFVVQSSSGAVQPGYPFQFSLSRTRVVSEPGIHWVHPSISTATWVAGASTMVVDGLYLLTFLILSLGLGALRTGIRREKGSNRRWMYLLTWVPALTLLALVVFAISQTLLNGTGHWSSVPKGHIVYSGGHPALAALMGNCIWTVGIAGWLLSMVGLAVVANRVTVPPETLRWGRTVSVFTSISLTLTFLAFVVWGVAINVQSGQTQVAGAIVATYSRHDLWLPMMVALGLASVASILAATSARRSWRTIYSQRLWDT
jgi:hypothetical protein